MHFGKYHLTIAGNGSELDNVKTYINDHRISNISISGHVEGIEKHKILSKSHIMILPSFSEGMPISIIEAMLYGLVIVSRPIGGIPDWVKVPNNGYLIESLYENEYAEKILQISKDLTLMKDIQENNRKIAGENFTPNALSERLFKYYNSVLKS
jgi:glycosyltransferase involved in cell wall biosynthesis